MLNKNCILILFVFCNILAVNGQVPGPTKNNIPGTIKGKVVDLRTKSPLQYASLTLHKSTDSTQIAGSVSLKDGSFKLDKVTPGDYFLVAKYIGYKKETKKNIKITQNQHIAEIGTIPLNPDITLLEEVNVINSSNQIRQEINKKVLLIAPSMNNINHSAVDILQTLPSIQVDPDGGVSLRGSSKFIILINGIPTVRGNGNALKQIPASDIQQIDVITSPSSEYDAEGSAGIINIILKKNRINGINGQVAVKGGNYDSQGLNMDLNYKTGKWNFHVETDYTGQSYKPNLNFERLFTSNTIQKIISGGEQNRHNREHYLTGNIEYTPDTLSTLSLMTEMGNGRYRMFFPLNYHESVSNPQNSENILEKRSRDDINMNRTWDYSSSTLNYSRHVTNNSELKITGYLSSLIYNRDEKQDETIEYLSTRSGVSTGEGNHFLERCNDREYLIKLEYSFPIATSFKLMSGIQNRGFRENQSYQPTQRNTGETLWTPVADNHNLSLFSRRVSSGYMQLTGEIASIDIEAGTRLEREFRKIRTDTGIDDNTAHLIDLFPSLHLSKQLSADINLQAGYNERINRPVSTWLLLSPVFIDIDHYHMGNPFLKPERIRNTELNLTRNLRYGSFILSGFYQKVKDAMLRVQIPSENTSIITRFENFNHSTNAGIEMSLDFKLFKFLKALSSCSISRYGIEGVLNTQKINQHSTNSTFTQQIDLQITKTCDLLVNYFYYSPMATPQGKSKEVSSTNITVNRSFLNKSLNLSVRMQNLFGSNNSDFYTQTGNLYFRMRSVSDPRVFSISLTYQFNNFIKKERPTLETETAPGQF